MPPSSHAASHRSATSSQLSNAASHRSNTSSHLSTTTSHRSITSSQLSAATTHGSRADTLAAMDRDTPHQSEASRSDAPETHSSASSSTTRAEDDDGDSLFDHDRNYSFDSNNNNSHRFHTNHQWATSPSTLPATTGRPLFRNTSLLRSSLNTEIHTTAMGSMGAQFTMAGAVGEEEEEEGEGLGVVQQMLEDVVLAAQGAEGAGEQGIEETMSRVRGYRADMYRARLMMFPPAGEGMGCVFRR